MSLFSQVPPIFEALFGSTLLHFSIALHPSVACQAAPLCFNYCASFTLLLLFILPLTVSLCFFFKPIYTNLSVFCHIEIMK